MTNKFRPQRFTLKPFHVEAMRWEPHLPEAVGAMVGWLASLGVEFDHPSGAGSTTTLRIVDTGVAAPGGWIVRNKEGRVFPLPAREFADAYQASEVTQ